MTEIDEAKLPDLMIIRSHSPNFIKFAYRCDLNDIETRKHFEHLYPHLADISSNDAYVALFYYLPLI